VAYGAEWRLERHGYYEIDRYSLAAMYPSGNFGALFEGKQHVEEGFLEVQMPILKDTIVQTLNLDMSGRITNYSNSGLVETWKLGLQSQIIDDVKFRLTWSHDIRAPTIWDIAAPGALALRGCAAFVPGSTGSQGSSGPGTNYTNCYDKAGGNPTLNPERANTISAGFIFTPTFLDGLTASIDWYQIHLSGGITTPAFGDVISRCRSGETVYCPSLTFVDTNTGISYGYPAGTMYAISFVQLKPVNAGSFNTAGFDFNIAYGFDLFTGSMDVSFNGNYNYDFSRLLNDVYFQGAGGTGGYYTGGARFQGTLNFNYREGAWSYGLQFRGTGPSKMQLGTNSALNVKTGLNPLSYRRVEYDSFGVATFSSGETDGSASGFYTNYNRPSVRTDIRVQYRWSNNITLFANIDNLQNIPLGGFNGRRNYRVGVRFNY
jgi:outer membrane receptor protein involved in Fe transport